MSDSLKECPFCNGVFGKARIDIEAKRNIEEIVISCKCGGMVRMIVDGGGTRLQQIERAKGKAIHRWNRYPGEYVEWQ